MCFKAEMYDLTIGLCFFLPIFDIWTKHIVLNRKYALENLLRTYLAANQKLRQLIFCNHSGAMLFEAKSLIYLPAYHVVVRLVAI